MVTAKTYHPYPAILLSRRVKAEGRIVTGKTWVLIYCLILAVFSFLLLYLYQSVENKQHGFYLQGLLKEKVELTKEEQGLRTEIEKLYRLERINTVIVRENIPLETAVYSPVITP